MGGHPMYRGLDFELGETLDILRASVVTFAQRAIAPRAAQIDRDNDFREDQADCGCNQHVLIVHQAQNLRQRQRT